MSSLQELLLNRHSIRRYTDQKISPDDVRTILQAALLSPSSKSVRPWQFVVVEDPAKIAELAALKPRYQMSLTGNPAFAVAIVVDPGKSDMCFEDAAIAGQQMQLQAADLGIGSCWVQVRGRDDADGEPSELVVKRALEIPIDLTVESVMTFGYSAEKRRPVDPAKLQWEKVHIGKWRSDTPDKAE